MPKEVTIWKPSQLMAAELFAQNPKIQNREVAARCEVSENTVSRWVHTREFNELVLEKFEGMALARMPKTLKVAFDEADAGSAAHLKIILQYYGKLVHRVETTHKEESPFEAWQRLKKQGLENEVVDVQEAEIVDETQDDDQEANEDAQVYDKRPQGTGSDRKHISKRKQERTRELRRQRREIANRADSVGYPMLPPGRWGESKRNKWMEGLIEAERHFEETGERYISDSAS